MPNGQSALAIRDSELAPPLASPTTISGTVDDDTGVITGATLSTPPLEFETVALGFPVDVKATFTQVGQGSGLVAATPPPAAEGQPQKGTVALRVAVKVTLDLKVRDPNSDAIILEPHCETPAETPVQLEFLSDGPYTQATGGRIVDANFTIPTVPTSPTCISQVTGGVNELLAGSGHSLSLVIKGDLPVPELKPETTTTLTADPSTGSMRGTPVTLTATVAPVETNDLDPTGTVLFKEGTKALGTAELAPDGTATLTTTELRAGNRALSADYQGDAEFAPSTSAPLPYAVAPAPVLTADFPEYVARGAAPIEFDLTVDNVGSTRPVANGRIDVAIPGLFAASGFVLERQLPDSSWVTVPLPFNGALGMPAGTLGPANGTLLPAGAVQTHRLRVSAMSAAGIRPARVEVTLVPVNPDSGVSSPAVASSSYPFNIVTATRIATTTVVGVFDVRIRPGQTLYVDANVSTATGPATGGQVEFLIDGKVVPFRPETLHGPLAPKETRATLDPFGYALGQVDLPADITTGPHLVTARYLGTTSFLPSASTDPLPPANPYTLTVIDPLGPLYTCEYVGLVGVQMGAYLEAHIRLPAYAEDGAELDLADLEVTLIPGGFITSLFLPNVATNGGAGVNHIEIDLGDEGTIEGEGVAHESDIDTSDQFLRLQGLEGTIIADGEPDDIMPLPIEQISMSGVDFIGASFTFGCVPQAEPVLLDEVGIAGVSLTAETTAAPVRSGDPVVLTATAAPALQTGLIEFFSGSLSLGTASGATGTASLTVDDLPVGTNVLTARYYGVPLSPFTSNVVELLVRPAVECPEFVVSGTSATVRLVYLELLGRCPDQAGFDYWAGRLDGGTSPEVFARAISSSPEAVGMVVDDAYVTMLGRKADASGKAFWVERMISRGGRYDQLLADLGSSPEFWSQAGSSNAGFVGRVYEQLLNRTADQAGQDFWVGRLNAGTSPRALILSLANLDEPLGVLVGDSYLEILGRTPDTTERTDGVAFLRRTGDRSGLYAQLIGTQEFVDRAESFPNPED